MDLQARIQEIQARINRLRKIIEQGEVKNYPEPETTVKETKVDKEKLKNSSEVNDLKSKLMKKK